MYTRTPDDGGQLFISPQEVAILDSMMKGGQTLNLKAHFLSSLPSLSPITLTLVHLNISFNDLDVRLTTISFPHYTCTVIVSVDIISLTYIYMYIHDIVLVLC